MVENSQKHLRKFLYTPKPTNPPNEIQLLGLGNPLLDLVADVPIEFLRKYDLELDNAILVSDKQKPLYEELCQNYNIDYVAGGATQNTIRVCQGLIGNGQRFSTAFIGSIGKDDFGQNMKNLVEKEGLIGLYHEIEDKSTGICAVLVNKGERSLCTSLAAASVFHTGNLKEYWSYVERSKIIYSSCYVLAVSSEAMIELGKHCSDENKVFSSNLSATYLVEIFEKQMSELLLYVDILFGNESEFLHYSKIHNLNTSSLQEISQNIVKLPKKNKARSRIVIVTQGKEPTIVSYKKDDKVVSDYYPVDTLPVSDIIDTNGAGDAFSGGFLYGLTQNMEIERCVKYGHYAAREVIQKSGCTFDFEDKPDY